MKKTLLFICLLLLITQSASAYTSVYTYETSPCRVIWFTKGNATFSTTSDMFVGPFAEVDIPSVPPYCCRWVYTDLADPNIVYDLYLGDTGSAGDSAWDHIQLNQNASNVTAPFYRINKQACLDSGETSYNCDFQQIGADFWDGVDWVTMAFSRGVDYENTTWGYVSIFEPSWVDPFIDNTQYNTIIVKWQASAAYLPANPQNGCGTPKPERRIFTIY